MTSNVVKMSIMPKKTLSKSSAGAKITQAEWEVMRILWDADDPLSAAEVIARLEEKSNWNPKTIRTFLARLVQKQAVKAHKLGSPGFELLHFTPLIDEVSMLRAKQETFLGQFFGGTVRSMLAGCIQSGEISVDELLQLREMIDKQVKNATSREC
jgi:BlaI family penicillinase repressor